MKQSRIMSLIEAVVSILVGFGISVTAQAVFLPMFGVTISFAQNISFALVMTALSIARQYILRRIFEALHIRRPLSPFMQAVIAERFRQIEQEGWSIEHDDEHDHGELGRAAAAYLLHAGTESKTVPHEWPWDGSWWKPQGWRRDLVRAGALLIAEGERRDRARKPSQPRAQRNFGITARRG